MTCILLKKVNTCQTSSASESQMAFTQLQKQQCFLHGEADAVMGS